MFRSGRLQEEQRLVAKTCSFFWRIFLPQCPNFAELESSKEAKSYHENPCNRITCKKILPPPLPPPGNPDAIPRRPEEIDRLPRGNPKVGGRRGAFHTKKGRAGYTVPEITRVAVPGVTVHWPVEGSWV